MLEANNPEIRVDEIMQRIQEKVQARRQISAGGGVSMTAIDPALPGSAATEEAFTRAQQVADVGAAVPPMTRLRGPTRALAGGVAKVFLRIAQIITRDQRAFNNAVLELLRIFSDELAGTRSQAVALRRDEAALRSELAAVRTELSTVRTELTQARTLIAEGQAQNAQLRTSVSLQERRLISLLEDESNQVRRSGGKQPSDDLEHVLDGTYLGFEDEFRGSRAEIMQRGAVYLPVLRAAQSATENGAILDVGCGRGELLELLRAEGIAASGVDNNRAAVEQCQKLGLQVVLGDAFDILQGVPDSTLGGLTAIHLVEHLPYAQLLRLIDECLRILRPGGVAIFETPNPKNVLVGSGSFYLDPTHRNPVHPQTLNHLFRARGMLRVETTPLHPYPTEVRVPEDDSLLARRFNDYFYGPQDFAVLGYRP